MKSTIFKKGIFMFTGVLALLLLINCSNDDSDSANPVIQLTGTINSFESVDVLSHSVSQSVQVKGDALKSDLVISATNNFEVSLNDSSFSNQITISKDNANSGNTMFYVRFSPEETALGNITGELKIESEQATTVALALNGIALSIAPTMHVSESIISFEDTMVSQMSMASQVSIQGDNLDSEITLAVTEGFTISLDDINYAEALEINADNVNGQTTVYVKFAPTIIGETSGTLTVNNTLVDAVTVDLSGIALPVVYNYITFNEEALGFGGGFSQSAEQTFNLHEDMSNISQIKMYLQIDCPDTGCDDWDRFANVKVKDPDSGNWFEIGRYITPYWTGTQQLERGLEFDVTDFKSLLTGAVELRIYIENWTTKADIITVDFDYIEGTPDYPYYAVSEILGYHINSIDGVPYGVDHSFDLDKQVTIPGNAESTHLRTVISGWGHAGPNDPDGRPCAEWCYRTHNVKINGVNTFDHYLGPLGCGANPISNQNPGNWQPNRAGWCPGMVVPPRVDDFNTSMAGSSFTFEYDFEDWTNNLSNGNAYYATSTYVVVKSNTQINAPVVVD